MKWIKVSDKLPPLETDVLAYAGWEPYDFPNGRHLIFVARRWVYHDGTEFFNSVIQPSGNSEEYNQDIIYWMPLPRLPRKVKEEKT